MLSQKTIDVVKSTIPALNEHSVALTTLFYTKLFENNPEVKPFFNASNQSDGRQQKALAGAIVAFAQNVENLEALAEAVELISQKHASLMVKPHHYPIVGANLLAAIQELLGLSADHKVVTSWGEAYGFLAGILSNRESEIYAANTNRDGGWEGFRKFRVAKRVKESSLVTSFYFAPEDGGTLPDYLPGQYLTVRVPMADGQTTMRNYSLSDKSGSTQFRISVKHETGNKGAQPAGFVSNYLHTLLEEGGSIELGPPCGEFVLDSNVNPEKPLVFLAGGIGITPLLSMVKTALSKTPGQTAIFVHACQNKDVQAFRTVLNELSERHPNLTLRHRYTDASTDITGEDNASHGLVDCAFLESLIEDADAEYFICGPDGFMSAMTGLVSARGVADAQIRYESFGPKLG
ncbi:MAG: NO-inducible flavohemoprotein [Litorimonas sp.]